jgi:DNA helicase-2/ATP-dependent DNA helicase PcrA
MSKLNLQKNLNKEQYKAVTNINGVVQVNSVAGSGKTRVLTYRIAHMIKQGINPSNILVTTFTKKSAKEMKERLSKLLPKKYVSSLIMGTFHSIGYKILKHEYKKLDHPLKGFDLLYGSPQTWLIKDILKDFDIETTKTYNASYFKGKIKKLKQKLKSPESQLAHLLGGDLSDQEKELLEVYDEYEKRKTKKGKIDFSDMLYKLYNLMLEYPEIKKSYQERFKYILVDEAQDNNYSQYELIKLLGKPENNIFIVGDDDQSIYGFRGARPDKFIDFENNFDDNITMINLETNYRSVLYVINSANKLIKNNNHRIRKEAKSSKKGSKKQRPYYIKADDEDHEAEIVADSIQELQNHGESLEDTAILFRTNAQARALEDALISKGIPYVVFNSISFYERSEIKDLIAYLRLAYNTDNDNALERVINKPSRYLGKKFMQKLTKESMKRNISLYEALEYIEVKNYQRRGANKFRDCIEEIQVCMKKSNNVGQLFKDIREIIEYDEYINKKNGGEEDNDKLENLKSLTCAGERFNKVRDFLKHVSVILQAKHNDVDAVKLMTVHKSKGLEFNNVFLVGMSDGVLPHNHAIEGTEEDIEEERRLTYVAITRAKKFILATSPREYQGNRSTTSQFIYDADFKRFDLDKE